MDKWRSVGVCCGLSLGYAQNLPLSPLSHLVATPMVNQGQTATAEEVRTTRPSQMTMRKDNILKYEAAIPAVIEMSTEENTVLTDIAQGQAKLYRQQPHPADAG